MVETSDHGPAPGNRRVFCGRTLNLRSIGAIGYDMDYTLVHYRVERWEQQAYDRLREMLTDAGWPVSDLGFDPELFIRGLVVDTELGNVVKANRFGYVTRAFHGTRPLDFEQQRDVYRHTPVDLSEPRYYFLNTLFSLSETCLYAQLVDLYDEQRFPDVHGYSDLFRRVHACLDRAHLEGALKDQIVADPRRYIELDPDAARALLDQQQAGKRLMLITNSDWHYARAIMAYAFDPYLPSGTTWRDLFELVIVAARKPDFFASNLPLFRIVDERGMLKPVAASIPEPGLYFGGDAAKVERYLGLSGAEILYVGDHIFADVRMSKATLRWRTALILRELEEEVEALEAFRPTERRLAAMMADKHELEQQLCDVRLELQRLRCSDGAEVDDAAAALEERVAGLRQRLETLDSRIVPMAKAASEVGNPHWGPLLRAGNDKSDLARQVERSADVYTSRVSNFLAVTPFAYLRSVRGSMPHDPPTEGLPEESTRTGEGEAVKRER